MKKYFAVLLSLALFAPVMAFAQTSSTTPGSTGGYNGRFHRPVGQGGYAGTNANTAAVSLTTVTGTVVSVSGVSITLNGSNSTAYTVDATNAKIYRKFGAVMAITDIQTGDSLTVRGTVNGSEVTAATIRDMALQQKNGTFSGTVSALNGSSFTFQSKNRGSQTVNTTSSTTYKKNGQTDQNGLADILVGSTLMVSGVWDSTNSNITANSINIIIRNVNITGTVQSIAGEIITMTGQNSSSTVYTVDATNAKLIRRFGAVMAITDIQTGDTLTATGPLLMTSMVAKTIRDLSLQAHNGTFVGTVTAINGSSFTLQSKNRGPQTINTTASTIFRLGSPTTTIAGLAVGQTVTVSGVWDRTNSNVTANRVSIKVSSIHFTGSLQSISGSSLTVLARDRFILSA